MEDFGIGCVERERTYHLMDALKMYYENITTDWEGKLYCGITMKRDYKNCMFTYINDRICE